MEPQAKIAGMVLAAGCIVLVLKTLFKTSRKPAVITKADGLDHVLMAWDETNVLTIRNLLAGGIHAFGRTDGGKTSAMKKIAHAILKYLNCSLLILCSKPGEYLEWVELVKKAGREKDLMLINPSSHWRFNMLDYLSKGAAGIQEVVRFIMEVRSTILRESESSGGDSAAWKKYDETAIKNGTVALKCAGEEISAANLHKLFVSAPVSTKAIGSPDWLKSYCNEVLQKGFHAPKSSIMKADFEQSYDYLLKIWPAMGDRTRGSVLMGVTATLSAMNTGLTRELFGSTTNYVPEAAIARRKIVVVDVTQVEYGDVGVIANNGLKYIWQKVILRRRVTESSPIAGIWGDEASLLLSENDSDFLSRCRSNRGFQVYINQSIASYKKCLPADKAEAEIEALLANFSHKLFFALGDSKTAEWAAELCGKELQLLSGGNIQHTPYDPLSPGNDSHSSSFHEQYEYLARPEDFMVGLRTGSPVNDYQVDALLVRSGKTFSNGLPLIQVTFDQRFK